MYRYETHLHTAPVSRCARAGVREQLKFYSELGYDGVFVTNHFLDGNVNTDRALPYAEKLEFYLSDYFEALRLAPGFGIKVFFGVELSYSGTDFLIYGLDPDWYRSHPEIMDMGKKEELALMRSEGAFIVHAHPFRESAKTDHIRLYPRDVDAVETDNASRTDFENAAAAEYARLYGLPAVAGTDNHSGYKARVSGMECGEPLNEVRDYGRSVLEGKAKPFSLCPDREIFEWALAGKDGTVSVRLRTNPSTGFRWEWTADDGELVEEPVEYAGAGTDAGLCGAPSYVLYTFRRRSPGESTVYFRYRRPWEDCAPAREFFVRFKLREDGTVGMRRHDFS